MATKVWLSCCTTWARMHATLLQSSKHHVSCHHSLVRFSDISISTDLTQDGRFLYATLAKGNHIAALDISDLSNVKRLDDPNEDQPTVCPHYVKVTPDQKHLVVTDYFVQTGEIGIVNIPADFKGLYIDINDDGSLSFNRSIDFTKEFENRGGAKPHSVVVYDLTDPDKPYYY